MSKLDLKDISDAMRKLDICMMTTRTSKDMLESRPMSNNKDVDYAGDSYFFTLDSTGLVDDLKKHKQVCLTYQQPSHLLSKPLYICLSGDADRITDRSVMAQHWVKDLEKWFDKGLDTPGLTLIHVRAHHIKYWYGYDEGEIAVPELRKAS